MHQIEKNILDNKRFTPEDKDKFISEAAENVNSNYFEAPRVQKRGRKDVMKMMGKDNAWDNNDQIFDAKRLPTIGEDYAEEPMIHPTLILKRYQQIIGRGLYDKNEREDEYNKMRTELSSIKDAGVRKAE